MKIVTARQTRYNVSDQLLLDSGHIRAITKGLQELKMTRTELCSRIGLNLCALSKMLCYNRDVDGWLMPRHTFTRLNAILKINT